MENLSHSESTDTGPRHERGPAEERAAEEDAVIPEPRNIDTKQSGRPTGADQAAVNREDDPPA